MYLVFELFTPPPLIFFLFFFFNDTATTEIYTLSLHDALPISQHFGGVELTVMPGTLDELHHQHPQALPYGAKGSRSEEHTSELQSRPHLVCRLLLEKKKKQNRA